MVPDIGVKSGTTWVWSPKASTRTCPRAPGSVADVRQPAVAGPGPCRRGTGVRDARSSVPAWSGPAPRWLARARRRVLAVDAPRYRRARGGCRARWCCASGRAPATLDTWRARAPRPATRRTFTTRPRCWRRTQASRRWGWTWSPMPGRARSRSGRGARATRRRAFRRAGRRRASRRRRRGADVPLPITGPTTGRRA